MSIKLMDIVVAQLHPKGRDNRVPAFEMTVCCHWDRPAQGLAWLNLGALDQRAGQVRCNGHCLE